MLESACQRGQNKKNLGGVPGPGGRYLVPEGGVPGPRGCLVWGVYLVLGVSGPGGVPGLMGGIPAPGGCTWSWGCLVPGVTWSQGGVWSGGVWGVSGPEGCVWSQEGVWYWGVCLVPGRMSGTGGCLFQGVYLVPGGCVWSQGVWYPSMH